MQCKLHAGMRTCIFITCFNWLALNMIQRFDTRARVLRRTRDVILSSNIFNSLQRVYCIIRAFFLAFSQSPTNPLTRIAGGLWLRYCTIPPTEDRGLCLRDWPHALRVNRAKIVNMIEV